MRQTQRRSRANNNINYNQITMPWRILLVVVAFALLVPLQVVESKELPDWNEHMLDCFQDMRNADHNHDLKLSSSEFNDFANRYANRLFVSQNVVQRGNFWQLRELFEELCLVNPGDPQGNTLTIAGAEVIQSKAALDDKGSLYLQSKYSPPVYCSLFSTFSPFHGQFWFTYTQLCLRPGRPLFAGTEICEQAEKVLRKVGPQQAVSDRKGEKCNVHNTVIVYQ